MADDAALSIVSGAGTALLGVGLGAWLQEQRSRRDARQRALAVCRATRAGVEEAQSALATNLRLLDREVPLLANQEFLLEPLRPTSLPALDMFRAQQLPDVAPAAYVAAADVALRRDTVE